VIAQLSLSDLAGHTGSVALVLRHTLNVCVPDELAERARLRGLKVSALMQAVIAGDLERASSIQLRGQWLNPGARLAICLRFAFVSQIAFEDNGIRAPAQNFWISGR
jgi:post-segregation antitoxin (ccd killing protein)